MQAPRTFALGDIHGCNQVLQQLISWIEPTTHDTVIFLGDTIDRGPNSKGVLDSMMDLKTRCNVIFILGNHEEMLLGARLYNDIFKSWLKHGGRETLTSFNVELTPNGLKQIPPLYLNLLTSTRPFYETDEFIFTHATPLPDVPISQQDGEILRWRFFDGPQPAHVSGKTLVFGHSEQRKGQPLIMPHLIALDTWAYGNGWLSALDVTDSKTESWQVWQVNQARQQRKLNLPNLNLDPLNHDKNLTIQPALF